MRTRTCVSQIRLCRYSTYVKRVPLRFSRSKQLFLTLKIIEIKSIRIIYRNKPLFFYNSYVRIKRLALNLRLRKLRTLRTNKRIQLEIKVLTYETSTKPQWTYGLQL